MPVVVIANPKGGVGKSTITMMLAHALACLAKKRVLVIDLDTQCNSSFATVGNARLRKAGKRVAGYGASGRANTIIQYCGIGHEHMEYMIDDAPAKWGYYTPGSHFEIRSADENAQLRDLTWLFQNLDIFAAIAPTVEQIAIWILAEDLGWAELSAHAAANNIHNANAVALAAAHVNAIGVDIRQKRIWAERSNFVPAITDEGLKNIFANLESTN